jgi:FKBP-type peptidyl-prolyl cis-trans isomerase
MSSIGHKEKADSAGLIFIEEKAGTGNVPHFGSNTTINYKGWFLNGGLFDDSHASGTPFTFSYGAEGQVIPGIQRALSKMKAGGKAKIILPSGLAFGSYGSSSGIIPPHTPVVYEVELVSAE